MKDLDKISLQKCSLLRSCFETGKGAKKIRYLELRRMLEVANQENESAVKIEHQKAVASRLSFFQNLGKK